jgi:hypothetical protein
MRRVVVNADNSCLFTALGLLLVGPQRTHGDRLRRIVAESVRGGGDGDEWNEVSLGRSPAAYADWIQLPATWGGAVELAVLARAFRTRLVAWDVQSGRSIAFEPPGGATHVAFVLYDGLHYDAVAALPAHSPHVAAAAGALEVPPDGRVPDTAWVGRFEVGDAEAEAGAAALAHAARAARAFTDTTRFTLRCLVCQAGLVGEAGARDHARATGHSNFAEFGRR